MERLIIATFVGSSDEELIKGDFCPNYEIGGKSRTLGMPLRIHIRNVGEC